MKNRAKMRMENSGASDIILNIVVYAILIFLSVICFYPIWYVLAASFADSTEIIANPGMLLWPKEVVTQSYSMVLENPRFMQSFWNSIKIELISLPLNIVLTVCCGYFLASKGMMWKKVLAGLLMFTMFFNGGMVPNYLNIKDLHLYNTIWALVLPGAVSAYNSIICKTSIEAIPSDLFDAAYIDGANDFHVLFKVVLPLIKATLAVLLLYYGVAHWNAWFDASIYLEDNDKIPVQLVLRSILVANQDLTGGSGDEYNAYAETIKYAAIVISTFPILCVYPFLQKYFTKGALIGAVKG